jgi:hypothetical protein
MPRKVPGDGSSRHIRLSLFLLLLIPPIGLQAQSEKIVIAQRVQAPVIVDGRLAESAWGQAPELNFLLRVPTDRDDPGLVATSVKVLFDESRIYFGFICRDEEPQNVRARISGKDGDIRMDDSVYVLFDTSPGGAYFYYLGTNLFGVRFDGTVTRDGLTTDPEWDAVWEAKAQRTDFGWTVEMAVDFSSLAFDPEQQKSLSLIASRVVPRLDSVLWEGPLHPAFDNQQFSNLKSLGLENPGKRLRIMPYALAGTELSRSTNQAVGLDMRYAFTPRTTGRITVNPEFLTAEPDLEQVNLTPFELHLPEKREFFARGSGLFQQDIQLFYTKRIGNIYGGVKLFGETDGFEFAGLSAQAKGRQDGSDDAGHFSGLRLRRKWSDRAGIGLTTSNRVVDGRAAGAAGLDGSLRVSNGLRVFGQFATSYGDHNRDNRAFTLGAIWDRPILHARASYTHLGSRFGDNVNAVGFIPDDNRREIGGALSLDFPVGRNSIDLVRYASDYDAYWGMDGTLRSWQVEQAATVFFKQKWSILVHHTREYKLNEGYVEPLLVEQNIYDPVPTADILTYWDSELQAYVTNIVYKYWHTVQVPVPIKNFRNHRTRVVSSLDSGSGNAFSLSITMGRNYGLDFYMMEFSKQHRLGRALSFQYDFTFLRFYEKQRPLEHLKTWINVMRVAYDISRRWSASLFFQTNTTIKKYNLQALVTYAYRPDGVVQLIYQRGGSPFGTPSDQGHTFTLKFGYTF